MNVGGPAAIVTELLTHLDLDIHLLVGDVEAGEADYVELRAPSLPVTHIPGLGRTVRPTDDLRALGSLVGHLRRLRPDIVQTHTAKAGALGRAAAVTARVPARVHTFHGHLLHGYFSKNMTRSIVLAERALARVTDRIVAVGESVRAELLGAGIGRPTQYTVIPPGVTLPNPPPGREAARQVLGLPATGPVVVYVARLTGIKRPDRMIDVARALPEVSFVVAGDGPLQAEMRTDAPANVRFLGWRSDIENVYSAADVVLLTSDNEGMPVTLIEAALCGVPAVATNVGSTGEVVLDGRTGWIVPTDASALADAVRRLLLNETQRLEMGAAAQRWADEAFGVRAMAEAHRTLYESLMSDPPARHLRSKANRIRP
jgi:glycosyltransferase involved in cell wall biosynthesis